MISCVKSVSLPIGFVTIFLTKKMYATIVKPIIANEINSMFRVVAKNVRYRLRLPTGCKVTRSYGLEWYQRSISTGMEARFEIPDLEAQIKQQILVELEFDSLPDNSSIDIDAELGFEYFGQSTRTEVTGVIRFETTRDKQLIFSHVNKEVEAVMRMRDVVAKIKQATQLIDRDNSSATMILDQARTQLLSVGRDMECQALARAVRYHVERRVFLNGTRTVVLN